MAGIVSGGLEVDIDVTRSDFSLRLAFSVRPGETVALLGPNGAGKSTAVAAIAGLIGIDDGSIVLDERVLDDGDRRFVPASERRVGVVFQDYVLFPHLSALDNVAFGLRSQGLSRRDAAVRAGEWLADVGLDDVGDRKPADLSGGQAQRVALARAMACEPDILLLDEPLGALDVATHAALRRLLRSRLESFAGPSVLITHDPSDAFVLADRIVIVEDGAVTQVGTPEEIRRRPQTSYAADLAGLNLVEGIAAEGLVTVAGSDQRLAITDGSIEGRVLVSIHPRAIALHPEQPQGSPRNTWLASVDDIESLGDTVRVQLAAPLPLTVEITPAAAEDLGVVAGSSVWAALKATEVGVEPA